jgi:Peptidase A4 family
MSKNNSVEALRRYRTYDPPSAGFDPRTAPQAALLHHGLPRRPDPDTEPELMRLWQRAFARPINYIKAELATSPVSRRKRNALGNDPPIPSGEWGGAVAPIGDGARANMVYAQWVVPTVSALNPAGRNIQVGFWVGLDGLIGAGGQVLQAGVYVQVGSGQLGGGDVIYKAFTEWFDPTNNQPRVDVPNFSVGPGDTVSFLVCAPRPDFGQVTMMNLSRGLSTSVGISAPPGITSAGLSAEWVIEASLSELPYFYSVEFSDCVAATDQGLIDLSQAGISNIIGAPPTPASPIGKMLKDAYIDSPTRVIVLWRGFD